MKKFLAVLLISFMVVGISTPSLAFIISKYYWGKGPLKLSKNVVDILEYYFSGGKIGRYAKEQKKRWEPFFMVISPDGKHYSYYSNPYGPDVDVNPHYVGQAKKKCKKKAGQECFVFASGYKIVWQNGINKKRRLTKKEIKAGKTLQILQELGFYGGSITKTTKKEEKKQTKKKQSKKTEQSSDEDIVQKLKDLNEMYKSGALTKEEFEKAKKKLLN